MVCRDFGKSVVAFSLCGPWLLVLIIAYSYDVLSPFIPIMPLMLIIVVAEFLITGGLHADGLMDASDDGLFSGRGRARKLEIKVKDSRMEAFGSVAFVNYTFEMAVISFDSIGWNLYPWHLGLCL